MLAWRERDIRKVTLFEMVDTPYIPPRQGEMTRAYIPIKSCLIGNLVFSNVDVVLSFLSQGQIR